MKNKLMLLCTLIFLVVIIGCAKPTGQPDEKMTLNVKQCTLFEDDFNDAHQWLFSDANGNSLVFGQEWSIISENGNNILKGINHNWAHLDEEHWQDYLFKVKIKISKIGIHLNFRQHGEDRYFLGITEDGLYLHKNFNQGRDSATLLSLPEGIALDTWHEVAIGLNKNNINVFIDGNLKVDYTDTEPPLQGAIAFETLDDAVVYIDDVKVSSCLEELPTPQTEQPSLENTPSDQKKEQISTIEEDLSFPVDPEFNLPPDQDTPGWTQTAGPLGGTVIRMIPHQATVWASLYSGGIYELQKDDSWKQIAVGHGIPEVRAFDIVVDPNDPNIAYVPERIACGAKTINNGASWNPLCDKMLKFIDSPNFSPLTLALDPANSRILYVPGNTHDDTSILLVSKDGGETWEKHYTFDTHHDFNHLLFYHSKMYLSTREDGVFVSSDQGKSWKLMNDGLKELTTARLVIFKDNLYLQGALLQHNVREGGNLYRLAGDGSSWEQVPGLNQVTGLASDGNTIFIGTMDTKFWTSTDGLSFQDQASQGLPPDWVGEIVSLNSKIYVGAGGNGVYVSSDNGKNFEELNNGLISVATREVHVNPADDNEIYVGTWDRLGFYWSKNGGKGYKRVAADWFVLTLQPDFHDFSKLYLGGDRFFSGTVSGQFTEKNKPGSPMTFIKSIGIDPNNFNHVLVGVASQVAETPPGEGLWESKDGGDSWTRAQGIGNFAVYSILFNSNDPNIVYASALGGGVFKSADGGSHFISLGHGDELKYTYRLAMSPTDPNVLVASSNTFFGQLSTEEQISGKYGGIFQSRDAGATWKELTAGIRQYEGGEREEDFLGWLYNFGHLPNYEMVLIDPKNPDHLVVGHHGENVVETNDGGATWKKVGASEMVPGGVHNYAYCLGTSPSFNKFYACTCGRGLFRGVMNNNEYLSLSLTGDAVDSQESEVPQAHNAQQAKEIILSGEYNHQH